MNLNKFWKLALVASIFPVSSFAQDYNNSQAQAPMPEQNMAIITGQPQPQLQETEQSVSPAPVVTPQPQQNVQTLQIPASMQKKQEQDIYSYVNDSSAAQAAAPTPVPVVQPVGQEPAAQPVAAQSVVKNSDEVKAQGSFQEQFGSAPVNGQTMETYLAVAYEKNPGINSARDALRAADESVFQAESGYLPKLDATYNKSYQKLGFNGAPKDNYYPYTEALNLSQGIWGSGEIYFAVKAAQKRVLAAQHELKNTEQQFLLDAITAYINYIYTQKVLELAINNEKVLDEQLKASRQRFDVGDATKTDVAQSEARLSNARSSRVLSQGDFVNAQANFKKIFLVDAPERLPMPANLPDIPATFDDAMKLALNNNPQVVQLKYLVEGADNDINAKRSQLLPQVDMNGSLYKSQTPSIFGNYETEGQSLGVQVTVPIYDAGIDYSKTREARDRRNQARQQYNDMVNTIKSALQQAWQQISTSAANIDATKSSLTASEFALEGVREEQKEGARTILDVLDAEQERFTAETSHARAIKDSVISIYNLKAVLGDLTPSQLGLPVKDYDSSEHYKNTRFKLIGL